MRTMPHTSLHSSQTHRSSQVSLVIFIVLFPLFLLTSCIETEEYSNTPPPLPVAVQHEAYYRAEKVGLQLTDATGEGTLWFEFSDTVMAASHEDTTQQRMVYEPQYAAIAKHYENINFAWKTFQYFPDAPLEVVYNVAKLQLLTVNTQQDTIDLSEQVEMRFATAQRFIATGYTAREVSYISGTWRQLTAEELRWLPQHHDITCQLSAALLKSAQPLWVKTTFSDGTNCVTPLRK